jgi:hypothetical protein
MNAKVKSVKRRSGKYEVKIQVGDETHVVKNVKAKTLADQGNLRAQVLKETGHVLEEVSDWPRFLGVTLWGKQPNESQPDDDLTDLDDSPTTDE